jgi:hypothetical protein
MLSGSCLKSRAVVNEEVRQHMVKAVTEETDRAAINEG